MPKRQKPLAENAGFRLLEVNRGNGKELRVINAEGHSMGTWPADKLPDEHRTRFKIDEDSDILKADSEDDDSDDDSEDKVTINAEEDDEGDNGNSTDNGDDSDDDSGDSDGEDEDED